MPSEWFHPICRPCWDEHKPGQVPAAIAWDIRARERCCWCGDETRHGIYVRADPAPLPFHVTAH